MAGHCCLDDRRVAVFPIPEAEAEQQRQCRRLEPDHRIGPVLHNGAGQRSESGGRKRVVRIARDEGERQQQFRGPARDEPRVQSLYKEPHEWEMGCVDKPVSPIRRS